MPLASVTHQVPFNADSSFWASFARMPFNTPLQNTADYSNYLRRLSEWPRVVNEQIVLMRQGLERGMTQPRVILDGIEASAAAHVVRNAADSAFTPFSQRCKKPSKEARPLSRKRG